MVVVVVSVVVVVVVDGFGLVVVGAVVGAEVGGGRVGFGGEVGLDVPLDPAVVLGIPALLLVAPSTWLAASAAGPTLASVVVGPAMVVLDVVVSGPATTGVIVVEGDVRSTPVNASQADPQAAPGLTSAKAAVKARAAISEIADIRTRRRSRQLRSS